MSEEYTTEDFYNLATKKFGNKFTIKPIVVSDEDLELFNSKSDVSITKKDIEDYTGVWLLENKCPNCGHDLGGMFGSFAWGIVHGCGSCSECNKVSFRLYHYFGDSKYPMQAYSLIGF